MSDRFIDLKDKMKSLPLSDPNALKSLYVMTMDENGNPQRRKLPELNVVELFGAEEYGSMITLKDFTLKYIEQYAPGMIISDTQSNTASSWSMVLPNGVEINLQRYMVLILKIRGSLSIPWGYIRFLLIPNSKLSANMYFVCQETMETADKYQCQIFKVPFETVYSS